MENRYCVGNDCPDTNGNYVNIYDKLKDKNITWCHKNQVYDMVYEMNQKNNEDLQLNKL